MEKITGNELAYPLMHNDGDDTYTHPGLTIRQHFASMAMQGILSSSADRGISFIASESVKIADALITELNKPVK